MRTTEPKCDWTREIDVQIKLIRTQRKKGVKEKEEELHKIDRHRSTLFFIQKLHIFS